MKLKLPNSSSFKPVRSGFKQSAKTAMRNSFFGLLLLQFGFSSSTVKGQCAITSTPATSCASADQIQTFTLNNIPAVGNGGCSPGAYQLFNSPVWALTPGNSYNYTVTCGPTWQQGVAIWIDLNGDGLLTQNEQLASTPSSLLHTGSITIPLTAVPGNNRRMRLRCNFATLIPNNATTACDSWTFGETEDYLVDIISLTPCTGVPVANNVVVSPTSAICPNASANLSLANNYTVGGMTYQWQYSNVSSVGPWTTIPTGTSSAISSPTLNAPHYFSAIITCTNSTSSITATSGTVLVQSTTTNNVPYFEGFEGIAGPMGLPNCSWSASNLNTTCLTYTSVQANNRSPRTGQSYASFYYSPVQSSHFWSNQIWMEAGVTYSANVWYKTESVGYLTWQLNLKINGVQAPAGATVIATTGGAGSAVSGSYVLLSNTFTVGTSGFYHVGIEGTSNGVCCGYYLSWDDLEIMVPCHLNPVGLGVSSSTQTICQGENVSLTASGADTYTWNTGATTSAISVAPLFSAVYSVVGANSLSGCTETQSVSINVLPSPVVSVVGSNTVVCSGSSVLLYGIGADSYAWSNSTSGGNISVSPTVNTTYSVTGTNSYGCSDDASFAITVNPLPVINVNSTANNSVACVEDLVTLTASNALSYQWSAVNSMLIGNPVNVTPGSTVTYTVVGTDANGCKGETTYALTVTECVGLKDVSTTASGIKLYPNPNQGDFVIEIHNKKVNSVEVSDLTGRVLVSLSSSNEKINIDLSNFANGVYYVKVSSDMNPEVIKIVKQ